MKLILQQAFPFLSDEEVGILLHIGKQRMLKSKTILLHAKSIPNSLFFIASGTLRGYFWDESGNERTMFIRPEHTFFAAPEVLRHPTPTRYNIETIQASTVIEFPFLEFEQLTQKHLGLARLYIELLKENLLMLVFRVEMLAGKTPEERYHILMERHPHFFQHYSHKYIANYLGITPNSLSRIIKRMKRGNS